MLGVIVGVVAALSERPLLTSVAAFELLSSIVAHGATSTPAVGWLAACARRPAGLRPKGSEKTFQSENA